jgi:hypothetical protein
MSRFGRSLLVFSSTVLLLASPALGVAGSWKFEFDSREHPTLSYSESGKIQFLLGCGRAFGLHAKYPGTAKKSGKASITIGNARTEMKLLGEFEEPAR